MPPLPLAAACRCCCRRSLLLLPPLLPLLPLATLLHHGLHCLRPHAARHLILFVF